MVVLLRMLAAARAESAPRCGLAPGVGGVNQNGSVVVVE
jgi:hypothetical protein